MDKKDNCDDHDLPEQVHSVAGSNIMVILPFLKIMVLK